MAQALEHFEATCEPLLPADVAKSMKAMFRRKIGALATDCIELMELGDEAMNGYARDIKDRLHPDAHLSPGPSRKE